MSNRSLSRIHDIPVQRHGASLATWDVGEHLIGEALDPFIVVSLYDMTGPTFPPHPHAGFAVATYILPESPIGFFNQDSLGTRNRIAPGGLHVTVAGSGALHEEQPERAGATARGFQIWMDYENGKRNVPPASKSLEPSAIPSTTINGAHIRAVVGASNGLMSPLSVQTPLRIIDVALETGAGFTQELTGEENAFLFVHSGEIAVASDVAHAGQVAVSTTGGETLAVTANDGPARFTLFAGQPFRQPRAQRGPMVASDQRELAGFMQAYASGAMGTLRPFSENPF
jgi:redox-sensitive bicupin YhaK (pirin superfamily)